MSGMFLAAWYEPIEQKVPGVMREMEGHRYGYCANTHLWHRNKESERNMYINDSKWVYEEISPEQAREYRDQVQPIINRGVGAYVFRRMVGQIPDEVRTDAEVGLVKRDEDRPLSGKYVRELVSRLESERLFVRYPREKKASAQNLVYEINAGTRAQFADLGVRARAVEVGDQVHVFLAPRSFSEVA